MKKIISLFFLGLIFSLSFTSTSEARITEYESEFVEPQVQFNVDLKYETTSSLGTHIVFSKGDRNTFWVFSPSSPPQLNIDGYIYQPSAFYHKSGPSQYIGYHSYASVENLPMIVLQKILNAKEVSITLFFTNQDTLYIKVPANVLDEWKTLIKMSWQD